MPELQDPAAGAPVDRTPAANIAPVDGSVVNTFEPDVPGTRTPEPSATPAPSAEAPRADVDGTAPVPVNPVRSAAGRLGAERRKQLILYGKQYERDHHLTPGRQRQRQLVQLGKRYEQEHSLRTAKPKRKRRGDAWLEFLTALVRVVKPTHRPALEQLIVTLSERGSAPGGGQSAPE
jgi:hypothetical protein